MTKTKPSIWILEDDPSCSFVYNDVLGTAYNLQFFSSLTAFRQGLDDRDAFAKADLIIADLVLPDGSFVDFFANRPTDLHKPLFVVSSLEEAETLRYFFESGAVDYLTKPFKQVELETKIERFFLRKQTHPTPPIPVEVREALTKKELDLLEVFLRAPDFRTHRTQLENEAWPSTFVQQKALHVHLHNLRKKLQPFQIEILSLGSGGYQLSGNGMHALLA